MSDDQPNPILFNCPMLVGRELEYIRQTVEATHTSGGGAFTERCVELLKSELAVPDVHLTPSCTDALEMCGILLDLEPGDEVIVPAYSFVSTVNPFVLRGARPVFADVHPDTLNIDERVVDGLIGPRTRAIVVVHYAGVGCEMDTLLEIARRHDLRLIEDNAHGLFGRYRGRQLGSFGCLAAQSFHETKNFSCGEGGALIVNDPELVERAEIVRDKGTNRQQLFRGEVDKYTWVDLGSSFVLSDILAAYLLAQLEAREEVMQRRSRIWERYDAALRPWVGEYGVRLAHVPDHCEQAYHMYYLLLPSLAARQGLIEHLRRRGMMAVFHYTPLHLSRMGRTYGGKPGDCPVTEAVADRLLRLPFHGGLSESDQVRVVDEIRTFLDSVG